MRKYGNALLRFTTFTPIPKETMKKGLLTPTATRKRRTVVGSPHSGRTLSWLSSDREDVIECFFVVFEIYDVLVIVARAKEAMQSCIVVLL